MLSEMTHKNQFNLDELSGAFGDFGTLIPFGVAYISLAHMESGGLLLGFGVAMVIAGVYYRTPFPVQPMKAIAAAIAQTSSFTYMTPKVVVGASVATGAIWLFLGATGLAKNPSRWIPRPALLGVVLGLGISFTIEGIRMMSQQWVFSSLMLALTLVFLARSRIPAMLALLVIGAGYALATQPALSNEIAAIKPSLRIPAFAWASLEWKDVWLGFVLLALPQLPLTFGNALISITDENNRLFPDRPVTERKVALSTGLMNLWSSAVGGIPMCHGAGGMAGHVKFGARTGGASIILGTMLLLTGLFVSDSVGTIFRLFPTPVLGVILFLAGIELAKGSRQALSEKAERFLILTTAAFAIWNAGAAVAYGAIASLARKRGWIRF
jgi:MFS superfamily sulfate permease-like transporter